MQSSESEFSLLIFKKYATECLSVRFCFYYRRIANGILCLYVDFYLNSFDCGIFCGIVAHDVFYCHAFCSTYLQRNCATKKPHLKELRKIVHFDFQFTTATFSKVHDLYSALRLQPIWITIKICACILCIHIAKWFSLRVSLKNGKHHYSYRKRRRSRIVQLKNERLIVPFALWIASL